MFRPPAITLRCDCGHEGRAAYGERWSCDRCGRTYDTAQIPEQDYASIRSLNSRYRAVAIAIVVAFALILLLVAVTGGFLQVLAGLGVILISWFLYIKPLVHRRHRRAVQSLTRRWQLQSQGGPKA
jgi:ABC-type transport system involved in cytochrome bd biosynthesis fused ATPase/permease subunit